MGEAVVEQRDIEIFLTLAEELHFGRTAERLHVSTARVSQTIKKLERGIGTTLFERTSRHVALTPIGRRLDDDKRPDISYIPIRDGLPRERRLTWRTTAETSRIRAFNQTVRGFVDARANPLADPGPRNGGTRRWT
jgi:hypothetical protein